MPSPKARYTIRDVRRARARAAVGRGLADRGPGGGARRHRATPRVPRSATSRSLVVRDRDRRARTRSTTRAGTAARRSPTGAARSRRRRLPAVPVPRLDLRARRPARRTCLDREDFGDACPTTSRLAPVRVDTLGRLRVRQPRPRRRAAARVPRPAARRCSRRTASTRCASARYRTTVLAANWKAVVDAFNEGYHVQGLHPQILPWTDDTSIAYEQFERARALRPAAGRAPRAAAEPAARSRAPTSTTRARSSAGSSHGLGGAFLARRARASSRSCARAGRRRARRCSARYQERRRDAARRRAGSTCRASPTTSSRAREDVFWFPNVVGPIYPGSAMLFRVRPNGRDPHSAINDTWVLEWPDASRDAAPAARRDGRLARVRVGRGHAAGLRQPRARAARHARRIGGVAVPEPAPGGQRRAPAPGARPLPLRLTVVRGSGGEARTRDILINSQTLCQLSYPGRSSEDSKALVRAP